MGYDEDARAGRVPFDQVVPNFIDPRLEGWVPVRQYLVPSEWRYELREIRPWTSGTLFGRREHLLVYYDIVEVSGERVPGGSPYHYERPREVDLRELPGLLSYAARIPQGEAQDRDLVSAGGGPPLDRWVVVNARLAARNLEQLRDLIDQVAAGTMEFPQIAYDLAETIAETAYRLGRQTREDELRTDFEDPAERGMKNRDAVVRGAKATIDKRRQDRSANKAHAEALATAALAGALPIGHKTWTIGLLAEEVSASWKLETKRPSTATIKSMLKEARGEGVQALAGVT